MPLIKDGRFASDDWVRFAPESNASRISELEKVLLPFAMLSEKGEERAQAGRSIGVEISNDTDTDALVTWLDRLNLISVLFPKAADGRGYSIATRLRRLGYQGELRATGHLIADQYALARSCGFDTVEISAAQAERQPEEHWMEAQRAMSLAYQRGYGRLQNILSARWASDESNARSDERRQSL
jgi:uncharacterized protein (DUF934 family)